MRGKIMQLFQPYEMPNNNLEINCLFDNQYILDNLYYYYVYTYKLNLYDNKLNLMNIVYIYESEILEHINQYNIDIYEYLIHINDSFYLYIQYYNLDKRIMINLVFKHNFSWIYLSRYTYYDIITKNVFDINRIRQTIKDQVYPYKEFVLKQKCQVSRIMPLIKKIVFHIRMMEKFI